MLQAIDNDDSLNPHPDEAPEEPEAQDTEQEDTRPEDPDAIDTGLVDAEVIPEVN